MRIGSRCPLIILVLWSLTGVAARAQGDASATGSITGRITSSGKPAAGVTVLLEREPTSAPDNFYARMYQRASSYKAMTDADGFYRFDHLAAGKYAIEAQTPAYVVSNTWRKAWLPLRGLELGEGETLKQDFTLVRGGVITGRVTDGKGRPVPEQVVQLEAITDDYEHYVDVDRLHQVMVFRGAYKTDDRGVYRIYGLPSGRYRITVGRPDIDLLTYRVKGRPREKTYYPGVTDADRATVVEVKEGSELTGIDIRFGLPSATYKVGGRLVDAATGKPLPGAMIRYSALAKDGDRDSFEIPSNVEATNEKGEFQFRDMRPGKYIAYAEPDENSEFYGVYTSFEITDADVPNLIVKAPRGQTVSGTVIIEGDADATEQANLARAGLMADSSGGNSAATMFRNYQVKVAADGSFRLAGVPPGQLTFEVFYFTVPKRFQLLRVERGGIEQKSGIEVKAGENISDVRLVVIVATGIVRGQVKVTGDLPLKEARLKALVHRVGGGEFELGVGQIDPSGEFIINHLRPGEYELSIYRERDNQTMLASQRAQVSNDKETTVSFTVSLSKDKQEK